MNQGRLKRPGKSPPNETDSETFGHHRRDMFGTLRIGHRASQARTVLPRRRALPSSPFTPESSDGEISPSRRGSLRTYRGPPAEYVRYGYGRYSRENLASWCRPCTRYTDGLCRSPGYVLSTPEGHQSR